MMDRTEINREFYECIADIAAHPLVKQMTEYVQHGNTSCYQHCLYVAYYNFLICKALGLRAEEAARSGMLHDMFLYDWHTDNEESNVRFHGVTHPRRAMEIADKSFRLSELEKDMILKHMWPLTLVLPRYAETFVICLVDKLCSIYETVEYRYHTIFG